MMWKQKIQKLVFTFVCLSVLFSTTVLAKTTPFHDVKGHWAESAIAYVTAQGIFSGVTQTEFKPNQVITRGMMVAVLGRLAEVKKGDQEVPFFDVDPDAYYAPYITWAAEKGIVSGMGDGRFTPDAPITREQMCVMMTQYAKKMGIPLLSGTPEFSDASDIDNWAKDAVGSMQASNIISGINGKFEPKKSTTRAEAAVIFERFMDRR